jgi:hypothetical protein
MNVKLWMESVHFASLAVSLTTLTFMWRRHMLSAFRFLASYIAVHALTLIVAIAVLFFRKELGMTKQLAYEVYVWCFWPGFVLQLVCLMGVVFDVYALALRPFEPLRKLGMIVFRWAAGISVVVAVAIVVGPHMLTGNVGVAIVAQLQKAACILTLCMLVFVCFALRPLGVSFRSRMFGAALGLGVISCVDLVLSAWFQTDATHTLYSSVFVYSGLGALAGQLIWLTYAILPEPAQNWVLLPTTSPYFFWNRISEVLGDSPGFVAVSGVRPEHFAASELESIAAPVTVQPEVSVPLRPLAVNR